MLLETTNLRNDFLETMRQWDNERKLLVDISDTVLHDRFILHIQIAMVRFIEMQDEEATLGSD